ncbi:MAG: ATP-binding protein [Bacteroidetes bacterium]|nr:ATP-binding protein [Bacteroidota bacterium]
MSLKKIVVVGPESTGKSTLSEQLAAHFNAKWLPEYAREYLLTNGKEYTINDLLVIAKKQIETEDQQIEEMEKKGGSLLIIDTDLIVIKVWSEFVFGYCDTWILQQIALRQYDGYLLCDVDLPWVQDALREYPDKEIRQQLFKYYKENMSAQNAPWAIISGKYEERLTTAVRFVEGLI